MSEWQPIETAPKDGTLVDLFIFPPWANEPYPEARIRGPAGVFVLPAGKRIAGKRFINAVWDEFLGDWRCKDDMHYVNKPYWPASHWMLAPEEPQPLMTRGKSDEGC